MTETKTQDVIIYLDGSKNCSYTKWLDSLDIITSMRIHQRIVRLSKGNLGDYKFLGDGVYELRIHFGSGYRVYFGREHDEIVVLLCGGDKKTQNNDIKITKSYWKDYLENKK